MDFESECETKISLACAQVKAVSPNTECYMYTESDWARTQYSLGNSLDALEGTGMKNAPVVEDDGYEAPGYELYCANSYPGTWDNATCKACDPQLDFTYYFQAYDFRNPKTRDMWVDRVVGTMGAGGSVDGAFVDGNRDNWGSSVTNACEKDEQSAWSEGLNASMWALREACDAAGSPRGCTIISNYATAQALTMSDGGMLERWGCSTKNIAQLNEYSAEGKIVQVRRRECARAVEQSRVHSEGRA